MSGGFDMACNLPCLWQHPHELELNNYSLITSSKRSFAGCVNDSGCYSDNDCCGSDHCNYVHDCVSFAFG